MATKRSAQATFQRPSRKRASFASVGKQRRVGQPTVRASRRGRTAQVTSRRTSGSVVPKGKARLDIVRAKLAVKRAAGTTKKVTGDVPRRKSIVASRPKVRSAAPKKFLSEGPTRASLARENLKIKQRKRGAGISGGISTRSKKAGKAIIRKGIKFGITPVRRKKK